MPQRQTQIVSWIWTALILLSAGCGSQAPFDMAPVTGEVKFKAGGVPQGQISRLYFEPDGIPTSQGIAAKAAEGEIKPDGTFTLRTGDQPGAALGKYRARLDIPVKYPGTEQAVPMKYTKFTETPFKFEVVAGANHFKLEVEK